MMKKLLLLSILLASMPICISKDNKQATAQNQITNADDTLKTKKLTKQNFPALGLEYTNDLIFDEEIPSTYRSTKESIENYKTSKNKKYLRYIKQNKETVPLYIKYINPVIGYGAFADCDLKKGDFIGRYTGNVLNEEKFLLQDGKAIDYAWVLPEIEIKDKQGKTKTISLIVDGYKQGNELRFVNDNEDDEKINTEAIYVFDNHKKPHIMYVATKPIKKDVELFVHYGKDYWEDPRRKSYLEQEKKRNN